MLARPIFASLLLLAIALAAVSAEPARYGRHGITRTVTHTVTKTPTVTVKSVVTKTISCNRQRYMLGRNKEKVRHERRDTEECHVARRKSKSHGRAAGRYNVKTITKTHTVTAHGSTRTVHRTSTKTVCYSKPKTTNTPTTAPATTNATGVYSSVPSTTTTPAGVAPATATGYKGATGYSAPDQLKLHNDKRALHYTSSQKTPPLAYNDTLAQYALNYGLQCKGTHSNGPYGENLAWQTGGIDSSTSAQLFSYWYEESNGYNYNSNSFDAETGHFTQLIWKDTTQLGCALVQCPGSSDGTLWGSSTPYVSLTCSYSPFGNYNGEFIENVLPPGN